MTSYLRDTTLVVGSGAERNSTITALPKKSEAGPGSTHGFDPGTRLHYILGAKITWFEEIARPNRPAQTLLQDVQIRISGDRHSDIQRHSVPPGWCLPSEMSVATHTARLRQRLVSYGSWR